MTKGRVVIPRRARTAKPNYNIGVDEATHRALGELARETRQTRGAIVKMLVQRAVPDPKASQ